MIGFNPAPFCTENEANYPVCSDDHPISDEVASVITSVDGGQIDGASPNALPSETANALDELDRAKLFGHLNNAIEGLECLHGDRALERARLRALIKSGWTTELWKLHQLCPGFYMHYCALEGSARLLVALEEECGQRIDFENAHENEGLSDRGDSPRLPELATHLHSIARAKAEEIDFDFDALLKSVRSRRPNGGATLSV